MVVQRYKQSFSRRKYMVLHCKVGWRWDKEVGCKASVDHNTTIPCNTMQENAIRCKEGLEGFRRPQSETGSLQEDAGHLSTRNSWHLCRFLCSCYLYLCFGCLHYSLELCFPRTNSWALVDWLKPRKTPGRALC